MLSENEQLEQNQREEPMSFMTKVIITGLVGGILWSSLGYVAYIFNFTEISPNFVLQPWALGAWKDGMLGNFISIVVIGVLGIGAAIVYFAALKKFPQFWIGILYGGALWGLVFIILNPMFPSIETINKLTLETNVTSLCLFVLFGVFVGYSISFEHNEMQYRKQHGSHEHTPNK